MAVDASVIGRPTLHARVVVERGAVENFARALDVKDPVQRDPAAAAEAGFAGIPAPPTWGFVMGHWGAFRELQPEDRVEGNPVGEVIGPLLAKGGLLLHGEQSFEYHRPIVVGDTLRGKGSVVDVYERESKGRTMTFVVVRTEWTDDATGDPVLTTTANFIHRA